MGVLGLMGKRNRREIEILGLERWERGGIGEIDMCRGGVGRSLNRREGEGKEEGGVLGVERRGRGVVREKSKITEGRREGRGVRGRRGRDIQEEGFVEEGSSLIEGKEEKWKERKKEKKETGVEGERNRREEFGDRRNRKAREKIVVPEI